MNKEKIEKFIIEICIKLAKQGKGALFIIQESNLDYDLLVRNYDVPFSLFDNKRDIEGLAAITDGAIIIGADGQIIAYSAKIKNTKVLKGFGTRHAAAFSSSLQGNTAILLSEEDGYIKIFKNGEMKPVLELYALKENLDKTIRDNPIILKSLGVGTLAQAGVASFLAVIPTSVSSIISSGLGIALVPGVIFFGSSAAYLLHKTIGGRRK